MSTALITDSTATLSDELLDHPDIYQVFLKVTFPDGEVFTDTNDETVTKRFYQRMNETDTIPTTSQPEPGQYVKLMDELVEKGYDNALFIHLAENLSGTLQTAQMVANQYKDKINSYFVDSKGVSFIIENILLQGQALLEAGNDLDTVVKKLQWVSDHAFIYVILEDLDNLVKGGRLSKGSALVGNLLKIKPILIVDENGEVKVFAKPRTIKRAYKRFYDLIDEAYEKYEGKINLAFAHGNVKEELEKVKNTVEEKYPELNYRFGYLTPILGTHGGQGAKGMGIIPIVEA